ncbi:hypothetical protein MKX50_00410 [Paenibacillus sp. FSL W8-0186]|uniref:hypothetical protein n=1 Tax=Paenibacillus sp. FSL W8-0186 TaxID=2921709 RepID=UPI0030D254A4
MVAGAALTVEYAGLIVVVAWIVDLASIVGIAGGYWIAEVPLMAAWILLPDAASASVVSNVWLVARSSFPAKVCMGAQLLCLLRASYSPTALVLAAVPFP